MKTDEDPNKPFSVARVAVWALGIIALIATVGLIFVADTDPQSASHLRGVVQTAVGALAAVAAAKGAGR